MLFNKYKIFCWFAIYTCFAHALNAQPKPEALKQIDKIYAILYTQEYLDHTLKLKKGADFYSMESDSTHRPPAKLSSKMYYYVYASLKTEQKSIFGDNAFKYFHHNDSLANIYGDSLKKAGFDVMVYNTAATSGAKFTQRMLEYNPGTISFIMFHESIHRHKQNTDSKLPYIFEEALGDVTGILFSSNAVTTKADKKTHAKFIRTNEKIYALVYKAIVGEISKEECTLKLKRTLVKGDLFQTDRFTYEVNNAFLIRYTSYIKYYFLLKEVYKKCPNPELFYSEIFKLSGSEEEVVVALKKLCSN